MSVGGLSGASPASSWLSGERPLERLAGLGGAAGELPMSGEPVAGRAPEQHVAAGAAARESTDDGSRRRVLWDVRHGLRLTAPRLADERASMCLVVRTAVRGRHQLIITSELERRFLGVEPLAERA
jgi:hypothetical protein